MHRKKNSVLRKYFATATVFFLQCNIYVAGFNTFGTSILFPNSFASRPRFVPHLSMSRVMLAPLDYLISPLSLPNRTFVRHRRIRNTTSLSVARPVRGDPSPLTNADRCGTTRARRGVRVGFPMKSFPLGLFYVFVCFDRPARRRRGSDFSGKQMESNSISTASPLRVKKILKFEKNGSKIMNFLFNLF